MLCHDVAPYVLEVVGVMRPVADGAVISSVRPNHMAVKAKLVIKERTTIQEVLDFYTQYSLR